MADIEAQADAPVDADVPAPTKTYEMRICCGDGAIKVVSLDAADIDKECEEWGIDPHQVLYERSIPYGNLTAVRTLVDGRVVKRG